MMPSAAARCRWRLYVRQHQACARRIRESIVSSRTEPARSISRRRRRRAAEMFGQQPIADATDTLFGRVIAAASTARSHSVSRPIERCEQLADPIRDERIVDDHHLRMDEGGHVVCARRQRIDDAAARWLSAAIQVPEDARRGRRPSSFCSSQPWHSCGVTTITSGPSGSASRAAERARRGSSFVKYWLSM